MCVSGGLWRTGGEFFTEKLNILWNPINGGACNISFIIITFG